MVTVTVIQGFRDLEAHVDRKPGDTFDTTEGRAEEIEARLPGYTRHEKTESDLSALDVDELRAIAVERGIDVPKRAGRAKLLSLLEE